MSPQSSSNPPNPTSAPEAALHASTLQVKGNAPSDVKRQCLLLMHVFVLTPDKSYAASVGRCLKLTEVDIWDGPGREKEYPRPAGSADRKGPGVAETVFETTVEQEMVNSLGVLHGGCAAYIIDICTASSILALGIVKGKLGEYAGVSQAMNIIWFQPIRLGTKIRITSTSMAVDGKIKTARCDIWNGDILCISATHSLASPGKGSLLKEGILVKL